MSVTPKPPPTALSAVWALERERGQRWLLQFMRSIAMRLGRTVSRVLLHPIALYFLLVNGQARRASRLYLGRALRRPARWAELYRHVHHFAATVLDRVYFLQNQFDQFSVGATGANILHEQLDRGRGVFLIGAHLGSFEALRSSAHHRGAQAAMLMFEDNARLINATLAAIAPQAALHTIALGRPGSMLALKQWLDKGGLAGMLADRTLPGHVGRAGSRYFDFLGHPACFSDGPFRLAALMRRPAIFMAGLYGGGKRYELRFELLADFSNSASATPADINLQIDDAMRRYVSILESLCLESPYNWFNFFDFWACPTELPTVHHAPASPPSPAP